MKVNVVLLLPPLVCVRLPDAVVCVVGWPSQRLQKAVAAAQFDTHKHCTLDTCPFLRRLTAMHDRCRSDARPAANVAEMLDMLRGCVAAWGEKSAGPAPQVMKQRERRSGPIVLLCGSNMAGLCLTFCATSNTQG